MTRRGPALGLIALVAVLWGGAFARDSVTQWVRATEMPPLHPASSVEVRGRMGGLLRAYTVEDGIWRLGAGPEEVDPRFLAMLLAWEDRRFAEHAGVDLRALLRGQCAAHAGKLAPRPQLCNCSAHEGSQPGTRG